MAVRGMGHRSGARTQTMRRTIPNRDQDAAIVHGSQKRQFPVVGVQATLDQPRRRSRRVALTPLNMGSSIKVIQRLFGICLPPLDQKNARTIRISCNVS